MSTSVSQEWMLFTGVFSFAAILVAGGFALSWYDRRERRGRVRHVPTPRANAGPHRPV
jgi:hypothetical protein